MTLASPAFKIARMSVVGEENEWVKMFDPQPVGASPPTPELMDPTNPVPEVMAAAGLLSISKAHTIQRDLLNGLKITTWDTLKQLQFFTFRDSDLKSPFNTGVYPAPTTRMPRGVIFHCQAHGQGPPPHTIHWHGIEPTPLNDGVGHCSIEFGTYFFQWQPNFVGTYFYHCHRNTPQHFEFGLFGLLPIMPADAYFASIASTDPVTGAVTLNSIPIGAGRDGKFRTAANVSWVLQPDGSIADLSAMFPGFNSNAIDVPDPEATNPNLPAWLKFQTDPHAMTVPYESEAIWVLDDRDSNWSDLAPDAFATFPAHGSYPGFNDNFHNNDNGFFAFNDFHPDYFFVTGVPVPAPVFGIGTINPSAPPPIGGIGGMAVPDGLIPAALNSGVSGSQVAINAQVNQTILVRCLDAAYSKTRITFPIDVVIIAWDGRALGMPPFNKYTMATLLPANTPITISTARRFDAFIRSASPINDFVKVEFLNARGNDLMMTAQIPITIVAPAGTFALSGTVRDNAGKALAGVTVTLTGTANLTTTTDGAGLYSIAGLASGNYTITPAKAGFAFAPPSISAVINGADVPGQNFVGTPVAAATFAISGTVTNKAGTPLVGITMTLAGAASATTMTAAGGTYSFLGLANGSYTVTPDAKGFTFVPKSQPVTIAGADVPGQNFTTNQKKG